MFLEWKFRWCLLTSNTHRMNLAGSENKRWHVKLIGFLKWKYASHRWLESCWRGRHRWYPFQQGCSTYSQSSGRLCKDPCRRDSLLYNETGVCHPISQKAGGNLVSGQLTEGFLTSIRRMEGYMSCFCDWKSGNGIFLKSNFLLLLNRFLHPQIPHH